MRSAVLFAALLYCTVSSAQQVGKMLAKEEEDDDEDAGNGFSEARMDQDDIDTAAAIMYQQFDMDADGYVSKHELRMALPNMLTQDQLQQNPIDEYVRGFMIMLDADGDGRGSKDEFVPFMEKMRDMDGRLDLLPQPAPKKSTKKSKSKRRKAHKEAPKAPKWTEDEL